MHNDPLSELLEMRLAGSEGSLPVDETARSSFPILFSFLTRRDVNGNLGKDPASVNIRLGLGSWLVQLTDPSLEVSITASVSELSGALVELEKTMSSTNAPWQPWRSSEGKFKKRSIGTPGQEGKKGS